MAVGIDNLTLPSYLKDKLQVSENISGSGSFPGYEFKSTRDINVNIILLIRDCEEPGLSPGRKMSAGVLF
jgi:hypothetical protein